MLFSYQNSTEIITLSVKEVKDIDAAWDYAIKEARGDSKKVIIEEFIDFELEITLLTIREKNGETNFTDN